MNKTARIDGLRFLIFVSGFVLAKYFSIPGMVVLIAYRMTVSFKCKTLKEYISNSYNSYNWRKYLLKD